MNTLKPYGWGIVNSSGEVGGSLVLDTEQKAIEHAENWNSSVSARFPEYGPYRVVQLFYKEGE